MKKVLVTGGAGYIGSHAVRALIAHDYEVVVVDNFSKGHKQAVDKKAVLVELDLADLEGLKRVFAEHDFVAVMHFAGSIEVGLSMKEPLEFFTNNCVNGMNLLEAMRGAPLRQGYAGPSAGAGVGAGVVPKLIFSSTAAVYGNPKSVPVKEDAELNPTNIYGETKLIFEQLLKKYSQFFGFNYVALRYFNAAGADLSGEIGQAYSPDTHIIPRFLRTALGAYPKFMLYGKDYPTPDGTCVRDYIHVSDLVDAHILALEYLLGGGTSDVFNLGNGNGFSNLQVLETAKKICNREVLIENAERRAGDPPVLVADSTKAKKVLGWKPKHSNLEEIIGSAWKWHSNHLNGYGGNDQ